MRNAFFFFLLALGQVVWAILFTSPLVVIIFAALGLGIVHIGLYNVQFSRARSLIYELDKAQTLRALCLGPKAPGKVWRGNGLVLAANSQELIAVSVPLLRNPELDWRSPLAACEAITKVGRLSSYLSVSSPAGSAALNGSKLEAEQVADAVRRAVPPRV